ncbi:hypothetical protein HAX54_037182, partial [Datura stramonium]|nr:hypothetical protein [Datura stramonium]
MGAIEMFGIDLRTTTFCDSPYGSSKTPMKRSGPIYSWLQATFGSPCCIKWFMDRYRRLTTLSPVYFEFLPSASHGESPAGSVVSSPRAVCFTDASSYLND